ncbi:MAG: glycosyltransferase family 2 protein [Pseudomonadales bacterium]|nr:glycosyltransferase family 2 protein [Candidatus Woesebacteria bacterium]MCB9802227.1 glycosyltransferase family 2 protein [Pseudomonadales bacterium]
MSTSQPFISIVIPSYNEMKNIRHGVLDEVLSFLQEQSFSWEVVLSDDGSSDGTVEELEKCAKKDARIRVLENPHRGKAPTVKAGMLKATGKWRLFTDFDQSTPLSELTTFLQIVKQQNPDIIIGSREGDGAQRDKEPFHRHLMGRVFNTLVQLLAVPGIEDTQCGFKLFSQDATKHLFNNLVIYGDEVERTDAFTGAFDVELLFLARKYNYQVVEQPIVWRHAASDRVSPVKDSLRMFRDIVRIRLADLTGKYRSSHS